MSPEQLSGKIGKSVGERLRAARIAQHYTQGQLAAPDFSVSYISAIERGQIHPSLRALEILAGRLGLSATQLLPERSREDHQGSILASHEHEDDEVTLTLLEAHVFIKEDMAEQAIAQLEKLPTRRLKRSQQLQHRYLLGRAYLKAARLQEAEYTLSEALQIAKDLDAQYVNARILNLLALTYAAMSNYTQALLYHQRCLKLLEHTLPEDPFFTLRVYMHMGRLYTHLDNFDEAVKMFNRGLEEIEEFGQPQALAAAYRDICQFYVAAKDYDLAFQYAYMCLYLSQQESASHIKSELYHFLGRALLRGDQERARRYLDTALQQASVLRDQLTHASVVACEAEWYYDHHELTLAEQRAEEAGALAQPFGDTIIGATTALICGRIAYGQQHYEEGDRQFVAGLAMLERLGYHEELADEAVHYAQLLEGIGREREAFVYFKQAFQSKQRTGR
jgi:transcriptional regulator with XRE-family HTH domain